jgi:TPP-dependent trihydroxycyclohexane-1,2-dione (THcHDO) dehydratase
MNAHHDKPLSTQPTVSLTVAQALVRYLSALRMLRADGQQLFFPNAGK